MKSQARLLAVQLLQRCMEEDRPLDELLGETDPETLLEAERRLLMALVYGVLRNLLRLDFYIDQLSSWKGSRLDAVVRWALRVALYQLEFLSHRPAAVVHEAVDTCKVLGKTSAGALVNAVLRRYLRERPALPSDSSVHSLSLRYSHPKWLISRYLERWGEARTLRLLKRNNTPARPPVWVNPFKSDGEEFLRNLEREGIPYQKSRRAPQAVFVDSPSLVRHPLYRAGSCFLMDEASQVVAGLPDLTGARRIGDFCAAPGGKAFIMASRMQPGGRIVCCDISLRRLALTRNRARQYGIPGLDFVVADLRHAAPFRLRFDFLLLDVPCSGLGTIRSNPDIRWKVRETDLLRYQDLQLQILQQAFRVLVAPGEILYSTCSTEPEENEQVIGRFLASEPAAFKEGEAFRSFPNWQAGEGFYAARIRHG